MPDSQQVLQQTNFTLIDWVIVATYPLISVAVGLYVRKLVKNMKDFVTAGQGLGVWLGIASMTGTEIGLVTVMYSAQKGFTGGFAAFHIALVAGIVTFVVGATGFIVYPLRQMRVLTIPEFYERRFDRKSRVLGGIIMAFGGILNMGLFLKVSSIFLVGITGWSAANSALPAVMIFLSVLVLIYTCLGGMISVVINDYVQCVALSFGLLLATALAAWKLGWSNLFETVEQVMGPSGIDPTVAESGFGWEYIIWMGFLGLVSCAVWPTSVAQSAGNGGCQIGQAVVYVCVAFVLDPLYDSLLLGHLRICVRLEHAIVETALFPGRLSTSCNAARRNRGSRQLICNTDFSRAAPSSRCDRNRHGRNGCRLHGDARQLLALLEFCPYAGRGGPNL